MAEATEGEEGGQEEAAEVPKRRFGGRRLRLIAVAAVLALIGLGGGLVAALGLSGVTHLFGGKTATSTAVAAAPQTALLNLEPIQVNVAGTNAAGAPVERYLRITLAVAYGGGKANAALMKEKEPFLRDAFVTYLRGLDDAELRGSAGLVTLKSELLKRALAVTGSTAPEAVLVEDMIIQ